MNRRFGVYLWAAVALGTTIRAAADDRAGGVPPAVTEGRITLNLDSTDIGNALRMVARQGGLNVVIGPSVEGEVSVYLDDVAVETALKAIAVNNGFAFTVEDGVITVSKPPARGEEKEAIPPLKTRIFTVQWQDAARVKDALEFALTKYGRIKVLNENSLDGYGGTKLSELSGEFDAGAAASSEPALGMRGAIGGGLASGALGVEMPRNARKLIVTDTAENLVMLADLIADLDRLPPQVLIEARIVEMTIDLQRQLGIDWDVNVLANGPVLNHELPLNWRSGFSGGAEIRHSPDGTVRTSTGLSLGTIDFSRFTALFRAHQTDNTIRLLANPRLLVFNNHSASILVGERYPLFEANITDFGTLTESFDTYIPVGIQLEVTPSIMADGKISGLVHVVTSSLGDVVTGTTGLNVNRLPTREIDTRVIMRDGQTIVLGGLISDRKTRTVNKVPGLGDWPIFSLFFRQESPRVERVDLLIFLTAHVEAATEMDERDREVHEMYRPHFKQIDRLQDVPLHFEIPTEYEPPKPMFGDPPVVHPQSDDDGPAGEDGVAASGTTVGRLPASRARGRRGALRPRFKTAATTPRTRKRIKFHDAKKLEAVSAAHSEGRP